MEIVRSKVLVIFVVLMLGVICISSFNNRRMEHNSITAAIQTR